VLLARDKDRVECSSHVKRLDYKQGTHNILETAQGAKVVSDPALKQQVTLS